MRLSKIKLAGFKSFVDPTSIHFPSNRVGIVGPNGCGKSNIIDAIRWVMGESSAKHLRGDSMADVIFNGSASRKPVGMATIELYFDNSDGAIGGQYAQYAEVCIKRSVSRDGMSQYYLNNVRCRRKDITGIFLGTGLGPRSYAIIEQGMISRLIEAKPEDVRVYIEEAAGISKYKERRRETENRIRHTRDNLDRLNDLREEVDKQIKHLQRQARQAERYKELKAEERSLEAELFALRLTDLRSEQESRELQLAQGQTSLEAVISEQRAIEATIEQARERHHEATEEFNATQGRYYGVQSEISRLEQTIAHTRETRERQASDLSQAQAQLEDIAREIDADCVQLEELDSSLEKLAPDLKQARTAELASGENLERVENALHEWQKTWHAFTLETKEYQQISHVESTRVEQLDVQLARFKERSAELVDAQDGISLDDLQEKSLAQTRVVDSAKIRVDAVAQELAKTDKETSQQRSHEQDCSAELESLHRELESRRGRAETLEALQEEALGQDVDELNRWVESESLQGRARLAQRLSVEKPWELAVETVLGDFLQAICVSRFDEHLSALPGTDLLMINDQPASDRHAEGSLLEKVENAGSTANILANVRVAVSLEEAVSLQDRAEPGVTTITQDGIWLGDGWVRVSRGLQEAGGLISREQDIRGLRERIRDFEQKIIHLEADRATARGQLDNLEKARAELTAESTESNRKFAEASTVLAGIQDEIERTKEHLTILNRDGQIVRDDLEAVAQAIVDSRSKHSHAVEALARVESRRPALEQQHSELLAELTQARETASQNRESVARINVEFESRRASRESANTSLARIHSQRDNLQDRVASLSGEVSESEEPIQRLQKELDGQLELEVGVERELSQQRHKLGEAETYLREQEMSRTECELKVTDSREAVDSLRMQARETEVRREGVVEQFSRLELDLETVTEGLEEDATFEAKDERLTKVRASVDRLGAINLAAIEEFSEQSERKVYLDSQFEDLTSALDTLEGAIRKIDRETRTRFQETFDSVNTGLKRLFPKLFGGGHAYLTLEGDDLLNAGVTVMARPPGKRNSTIHLLSGGEKALTAVALVFSIFELNPAPFCLLDEVDAPLDDANVSRFCDIVREMSETVQFLCITHNKTTMEMASQLTGVTMNEPGVSRLVSVDIDEAVQLVAS
jgi:chromosome segregation protein